MEATIVSYNGYPLHAIKSLRSIIPGLDLLMAKGIFDKLPVALDLSANQIQELTDNGFTIECADTKLNGLCKEKGDILIRLHAIEGEIRQHVNRFRGII